MVRFGTVRRRLARLLRRDDGSATVEWVLGTAAGVSLALAVSGAVRDGVEDLAGELSATLSGFEIPDYRAE